MAERSVGRPWTSEEDQKLTQAVAAFGEVDQWKAIAQHVPGRTNKACRKRWLHSLSPLVKKTAWTFDEDRQLIELYGKYPNKWSLIARHIQGRTDDACSKRYREALDPNLKKGEWAPEEDDRLVELHDIYGDKWMNIGHELQRSSLGSRNRWRLLQRKRAAAATTEPTFPSPFQSPFADYSSLQSSPATQSEASPWTPDPLIIVDTPSYWDGPPFSGHTPTIRLPPTQEELLITQLDDPLMNQDPDPLHSRPPPPFQFSSSSLSTALTDPRTLRPRIAEPRSPEHQPSELQISPLIPSVNPDTLGKTTNDRPFHEQLSHNVSGCLPPHRVSFLDGDSLRASIIRPQSHEYTPHDFQDTSPPTHSADLDYDSQIGSPTEEITSILHSRQLMDGRERSRSVPDISNDFPTSHEHEATSSTASTPISFAPLTLSSPASSPSNFASPVELPQLPADSMLFSSHYRPMNRPRVKVASPKKRPEPKRPVRLSSHLPATSDPSVLPYACGHQRCWPEGDTLSKARFATSRELAEHSKAEHDGRPGGETPFRCALDGCGGSWKTLNGLQYHLQLSKAHFRAAISSNFSSATSSQSADPIPASSASSEPEKARKIYVCPHENCINQYKQLSGLKYHLAHGHPEQLPVQLEAVPPALARKVAEKFQKKTPEN